MRRKSANRVATPTLKHTILTESTMNDAKKAVANGSVAFDESGLPNSLGIMALEQTEGRGQRGKNWFAKPGESLCVTYYFRHGLSDEKYLSFLSLMAGVAVARLLSDNALYGLQKAYQDKIYKGEAAELVIPELFESSHPFKLKWPNDILLNGKKIAGVLIERVHAPDGEAAYLIGVGINVKNLNFPEELQGFATSIANEGVPTESLNLKVLAEKLAELLAEEAEICLKSEGASTLTRWRIRNDTWGRAYSAQVEDQEIKGVAKGIDETGALILELSDGGKAVVNSATSWLS